MKFCFRYTEIVVPQHEFVGLSYYFQLLASFFNNTCLLNFSLIYLRTFVTFKIHEFLTKTQSILLWPNRFSNIVSHQIPPIGQKNKLSLVF